MSTLFFLIGLSFIVGGVSVYTGLNKTWWLNKSTAVTPTAIAYGLFPGSIVFFALAYTGYFPLSPTLNERVSFCVIMPSMALTVILSLVQPRFLKPKWLTWLEDHHGDILPILREEARSGDWSEWKYRVRTQEGLEEWVAEVRRKHKLN